MLRFKGSEFWADIAQVDGAWAPGRSQLVFLRRMSVEFSVDPISAFSRRGAGLSPRPRRLIRTYLLVRLGEVMSIMLGSVPAGGLCSSLPAGSEC